MQRDINERYSVTWNLLYMYKDTDFRPIKSINICLALISNTVSRLAQLISSDYPRHVISRSLDGLSTRD